MTVLQTIGGKAYEVAGISEVTAQLQLQFGNAGRCISVLKTFEPYATFYDIAQSSHLLHDVEVAIIPAQFAVAENGAVWVTDEVLPVRVLPFICRHLAVVVNRNHVVASMHEAYDRIGAAGYGFGTFIAGPSKTADIEQSLVLGAHGPETMTVFLLP